MLQKIKSKKAVFIAVVFVVVFIGVLINISKADLEDAVIEATLSELNQKGIQVQQLLEQSLSESTDDLNLIAQYIAKNELTQNEAIEFFETQTHIMEFDSLYYVDLNGKGLTAGNATRDFSSDETFKRALNGELFITQPLVLGDSNAIAFNISVPVVKNDEIIAVLCSEASIDDFFDTVKLNTSQTSDMFIVDYDLNVIFSTSENHISNEPVPADEVGEMGIENVIEAQENFLKGEGGGFYYDYFGTPKVMVYFPINSTSWVLAMNSETDEINSQLTQSVETAEAISSIIYWTVIALLFYITFAQVVSDKKMFKIAYYDALTGLPNVQKLKLEMTDILRQNKNKSYAMIVCDIENFKAINEMFGYEVGDRVLKAVKSFVESFNEPSLITARISGDRFALFAQSYFLNDISVLTSAMDGHFNALVPELADYNGTFKVGRYNIEQGETDFDDIMAKVNLAHARAKVTKGEFLCDYDADFKKKLLAEAEIVGKMKSAIENEEFKVYLQPKFSTQDNMLVGAEALVRWVETGGKMVFPNDFIPLFERNGFIVEIDRYVLENVCKTINRWERMGFGKLVVSVNCSRLNLQNPFFVDGVIAIADKYNVAHECIEIELTESATIENESVIEKILTDLKNNNFKVSIDDFGAGYSSLGMLKNLNVDTLKMDRSFFVAGKNERRDDMLVDSIVKMSHNLGLYVVAEGIETQEQVEMLKSVNCDAIQGYVYAKPMAISEFEAKYEQELSIMKKQK